MKKVLSIRKTPLVAVSLHIRWSENNLSREKRKDNVIETDRRRGRCSDPGLDRAERNDISAPAIAFTKGGLGQGHLLEIVGDDRVPVPEIEKDDHLPTLEIDEGDRHVRHLETFDTALPRLKRGRTGESYFSSRTKRR